MKLVDVWKIYKTGAIEYPALKGISTEIGRAEFVSVIGPSGSGKTSLLNLLGALDVPTKGDIVLDGVSYRSLTPSALTEIRRRKIGFVFQTFNLVSYLNVLENVELPMIPVGIEPSRRRERAMSLLERLGVADKAGKRPAELSSGEQQRVAIARALANDPSIILADEPTGNLDSKNTAMVASLLQELSKTYGKTVVLVTHNLEVARYADRIIHLRDGRIEREEILN
ncbi:MAG: ABC transporter ATP-binding protein [Candidatus Caldarchaeum sp.]